MSEHRAAVESQRQGRDLGEANDRTRQPPNALARRSIGRSPGGLGRELTSLSHALIGHPDVTEGAAAAVVG